MPDLDLDELRRLIDEGGPWEKRCVVAMAALPKLIAEVERLRQKLRATESAAADLRSTVDQLTSEMAGEQELARQAEAECERLRGDRMLAPLPGDALRARVTELESDVAILAKADETAESLHEDNMALRKRVAELERSLDMANAVERDQRKRVAELESALRPFAKLSKRPTGHSRVCKSHLGQAARALGEAE